MAPRPEMGATLGGRIWPSSAYMFAAATTSPLLIAASKACDMPSSGRSLARAAPATVSAAARIAKRVLRAAIISVSSWGLGGTEYEPGYGRLHCRPGPRMVDYPGAGEGSAGMTDEQVVWTGNPSQWRNFWWYLSCLLLLPI